MTNEILLTDGPRPKVRLERHLADPPAVVWRALTDREELRAWFPCDIEVKGGVWKAGAPLTFLFPPEVIDLTLKGEVIEVAEQRVLSFTWGEETLRFELSALEGGTRLVLTDELPPPSAARSAAGWDQCLDRLAGIEQSSDGWQPAFEAYAAAFEPIIGPQEGPPPGYKGE